MCCACLPSLPSRKTSSPSAAVEQADAEEHDAEQQRLVYVSLTRARDRLFVYSQGHSCGWSPECVYDQPSDFTQRIASGAPGCCCCTGER